MPPASKRGCEVAEAAGLGLILYLKEEGSFGSDKSAGLDAVARLVDSGICVGIKYAVVRPDALDDPYLKALRRARRQIRTQEGLLDKYLPFLHHHSFVFETRNIREAAGMLTTKDLERLKWEPENIDWADYWVNVHTKGIEKWIRPNLVTSGKQR